MNESIQEKAREQALSDWRNKSPVCWISGRLDPDQPAIAGGRIFYPRFCFIRTNEEQEFCSTYNQVVDELIAQEGIPDWAPVKRIPDRATICDILSMNSQDISALKYSSMREKNLVSSVLNKWKSGHPVVWSRPSAQSLLLLGGNVNEKAGRVDVLDTEGLKWLATAEFLRKHYSKLPWDS